MRITAFILVVWLFACGCATKNPAPSTEITLTKRADGGPYGTSAYSFRLISQDVAVHHNYVDLVFNGCGQLHVIPTAGLTNRVADLGAVSFATTAGAAPPSGAVWRQRSIMPHAGHVYLQQISDERQSFAVEYLVTEASHDTVKLRWRSLDPNRQVLPLPSNMGWAGTMGQCGSAHPHPER